MAEGLLRARLGASSGDRVSSAGLAAVEGRPADPKALDLLARYDLVLVMEEEHRREIERLARTARGRVHRIGKFAGFDVADPYGKPLAAFERALALIERGLDDFHQAFWRAA